jgi:hypothetical protein
MPSQSFEDQVQERKDEMIEVLEGIGLEEIKSTGLSLNFAGKTFKFTNMEVIEDEDLEEKIRSEFRSKLNSQQQRIREKINTKINQLLTMHQQKQNELERKERSLQEKYNNAAMMPDITYDHAKKGLMVVKNEGNHDELLWLFRGRYQAKFFLKSRARKTKAIKKDLRTRLVKDIIVRIKTKGSQIINVNTRNPDASMSAFYHYHKMSSDSDCWGSWKHPSSWSNPTDIIRCAKDALAVLETINEGSIATANPSGLPTIATVKEHLTTNNVDFENTINIEEVDVWSTD